MLKTPYLLFLGTENNPLAIKTSQGVAQWKRQECLGEFSASTPSLSIGLDPLQITEAAQKGAKTFIVGLANAGGKISEDWIPHILEAIEHKMDIAAGLHQKLSDIPVLVKAAARNGCKLYDLRHLPYALETGTGRKRSGKRMLMVGTDCSVGKMYTALSIEQEMIAQGYKVDFRATGQTGIFIKGSGISIDAVVSDFISGTVEALSPDNDPDHWDIIEGQGSLFNPAFSGVTLGLVHGAQADVLVMCHEIGRQTIKYMPDYPVPNAIEAMELYLQVARLTNPNVVFGGISLNGRLVTELESSLIRQKLEDELNLPCFDPMITGSEKFVSYLKKIGQL